MLVTNETHGNCTWKKEEMEENGRLSGQSLESRDRVNLGLNHGSVTLWFHDVFFETQSPLCKMGTVPTSHGGCEREIIMQNSQPGALHRGSNDSKDCCN